MSPAYRDSSPVRLDEEFPCRLKVRTVMSLSPDAAIPVLGLRDRLTVFQNVTGGGMTLSYSYDVSLRRIRRHRGAGRLAFPCPSCIEGVQRLC